jgi:hypothetical protein
MPKCVAVISAVFVAAVGLSGGTFTNTGSASQTCVFGGRPPVPPDQPFITQTATGAVINLTCPGSFYGPSAGSYQGTPVSGSAGDLSAIGGTGDAVQGSGATFSFQSTFTDSLVPVGGTGSGTVVFTLTYTWGGLEDVGTGNPAADLFFNGVKVWNQSDFVCPTPPEHGCDFPHTAVFTIVEPVTYDVPFSYQADDSVSGHGFGVGVSNSLTISPSLQSGGQLEEVPEPGSIWLSGVALLGLLLRSKCFLRA